MIFEPLDFIARVAALVPKPRAQIIPNKAKKSKPTKKNTSTEKHRPMTWAQRLKRVFGIDIETCIQCGGVVLHVGSTGQLFNINHQFNLAIVPFVLGFF